MEDQRDAYTWLFGFDIYIDEYKKAQNLSPELVNSLYQIHGGSSYEQQQLQIARRLLFKEWNDRPAILRRHGVKGKTRRKNRKIRK